MGLQAGIGLGDFLGHGPGPLQHVAIVGEAGQGEIGQARLTGSQHLARPPQAQVHLGNLKAVAGAHQQFQALAGQHVAAVVDQQTVGGGRPPAHPAAQLVQLGQAEALGMVDQHHAGLGNIHTYLHHRGAHQHLGVTGGKGGDGSLLVGAVEPSMQEADPQFGKHLFLELVIDLHGRAQVEFFRFFH